MVGRIFKSIPEKLYPCKDGTFSDSPNGCNYHGGIADKSPVILNKNKESTGVVMVSIDEINTAEKLFQNRKTAYSDESVKRIIQAVLQGTFDFAVLDPITIWHNPADKKYYILSGHSRKQAFKILNEKFKESPKEEIFRKYGNFSKIPAKTFKGSFEQAKQLALNSNNLSTKETDTERASKYKRMREAGKIEKEIFAESEKYEGKNANYIYNISFLNPNGLLFQALSNLENSTTVEGKENLKKLADWIGEGRRKYPELTNSHENEIFNWLIQVIGKQITNKKEFLQRLHSVIEKRTQFGVFEADKPLNLLNLVTKSNVELEFESIMAEARKELETAKKELDNKRNELVTRKANSIQIENILRDYELRVQAANKKLNELALRKNQVQEYAKNQTNLFAGVYDHIHTFGKRDFEGRGDLPYNPAFDLRKPSYPVRNNYDFLFDLTGNEIRYDTNGDLNLTIDAIKRAVGISVSQTKKLAAYLKADTLEQSAYNVWHWIKTNIRYKLDTPGNEEIRTANRSWKDRFTGVDCEDYTILAYAILVNMGYNPKAELVGFDPLDKKSFGHIFANVGNYTVDAVLGQFNNYPPNVQTTMKIQLLNGVSGVEAENKFMIAGLGGFAKPDSLTEKLMLKQTELLSGLSGLNNCGCEKKKELRKLRYMVALNGMPERNVVAAIMPYVHDIDSKGNLVFHPETDLGEVADIIEGIEDWHEERNLSGLGKRSREEKKQRREERKTARKAKKAERKATGKTFAKKILKPIAKYFPVTVVIRNAYLLAMKVNFGRMASRLKYSYYTREQAQQKGLDLSEFDKLVRVRKKVENIFDTMGGKPENLKNAIIKGGKGLSGLVNRLDTYNPNHADIAGLGEITAASIAAAMPAITATIAALSAGVNFLKLFKNADKQTAAESVADAVAENVKAEETSKPFAQSVQSVTASLPSPASSGGSSSVADIQEVEPVTESADTYSESDSEPTESEIEAELENTSGEETEPLSGIFDVFEKVKEVAVKAKGKAETLKKGLDKVKEKKGLLKKVGEKIKSGVEKLRKKYNEKQNINTGFNTPDEKAKLEKAAKDKQENQPSGTKSPDSNSQVQNPASENNVPASNLPANVDKTPEPGKTESAETNWLGWGAIAAAVMLLFR